MKATLDIDTITLFLFLVLPGLISMQVYRMVMPAYRIQWGTALLEGLFYSAINFALFSPLIYLLYGGILSDVRAVWYVLLWIAVLLVGPLLWPLLIRWIVRNTKLVRHLQLPYPSAWDYYFDKRHPAFALVHLKNGKMIGGYYGNESYATSFPNNGDIYLEAVYKVGEDGTFGAAVDDTDGVIIRREEYYYIELFKIPQPSPQTTEGQQDAGQAQ